MKTRFYERTAYQLSEQPIPNCFLKLDDYFDERLPIVQGYHPHPSVVLAESLCARFADVEMYAFLIEDARKRHGLEQGNDVKAAVLTRSFFVGYLGSARAFLDVAAVTLSTLYELPVTANERTFAHGNFWHQLVTAVPNVHRRYHTMRLFFNEVLRWCNETPYRVPPLYLSHEQFGPYSSREMHLRMLDEAPFDLTHIPADPIALKWVDPLHLHDRWKPQFLILCEKVCQDIAQRT
ncbi:MAG: hypothetical protein KDE53_17650 [Caldilineaceae bacterium]|nr:hypothetical protein [Caldilineaceae bacterium]MCB0121973.1 hypothetical protein [Caldilineaceae bacterium]